MMQNLELEIQLIRNFVDKNRQHRYIQFVSSPKNRSKFVNDLAHFSSFNSNLLEAVKGDVTSAVLLALRATSTDNRLCYVVSENPKLDTRTLDAKEAIDETVGYGMGTILVFGNADLIFYEGEMPNARFIGRRG